MLCSSLELREYHLLWYGGSMPYFNRDGSNTEVIQPLKLSGKQELWKLFEHNLSAIFNCKFVNEFITGLMHAVGIDIIFISEEKPR